MKRTKNHHTITRYAASALLGVGLAACQDTPPQTTDVTSASFVNGDFETGTAGQPPPSWTVATNINPNNVGFTPSTPQTYANLNLATGGTAKTVIEAGTNQADPTLGASASLRYCRYGSKCTLVNNLGANRNVNTLTQTMTIGASDVDPADGLYHLRFVYAPVLENPGHAASQQPYYMIQVTNVTRNQLIYSDFNLAGATGIGWKTVITATTEYDYTDWILVDISSGTTPIAANDQIKLDVIAAGCSQGAHMGEVYVDGVGAVLPGLSISGSGPSRVNPGDPIAYTLTYRNGSASDETGVTIEFTTPPGTTFQGLTTPAGATCTTPAVDGTGKIVCTFASPVSAGALASFTVAVKVDSTATGPIVCGNYEIHSASESPLTGNKIVTEVGCKADSDCSGGSWCNLTANKCSPKLTNGTSIPNDPPHTNPALGGTCTAPAAALVCASSVCDIDSRCGYANGGGTCSANTATTVCRSSVCDLADSKCGYANGDGTCSGANATTVCRSSVCDTVDNKCGYANGAGPCDSNNAALVCRSLVCDASDNLCGYDAGDGPCTPSTADTVCRSGLCSANGTCLPAGGCLVDADCSTGNWCNVGQRTCKPKLGNGSTMPTDGSHGSPTLDGTCSANAAALVCTSGVCDSDNKCGYDAGGGPCTSATATSVCRSGACSVNGTCLPPGGCLVDADCSTGHWCNEAQRACMPTLSNGTSIPTDPPHTNPTLGGTCTAAAGTLVCTSGVCDASDNKCGYDAGTGPCTQDNAPTVCRSGACSANGTCLPAGGCFVDTDCSIDTWCNERARTCAAKLPNGSAIPNDSPPHSNPTLDGTCTSAAAQLVCESGVCDTADGKCGYGNGTGPCTDATEHAACRSGVCGDDGKCGLPDGTACTNAAECRAGACSSGGYCGPGFTVQGGGGCSSTRGSGGNALLLALAMIGVLRRRRRTV